MVLLSETKFKGKEKKEDEFDVRSRRYGVNMGERRDFCWETGLMLLVRERILLEFCCETAGVPSVR